MLRAVALTLLCLTAIAAPAEAGDRGRADQDGTRNAAQEIATAAMEAVAHGWAEVARMSGAAPGARAAAQTAGSFRREVINRPITSASLRSLGRGYGVSGDATWLDRDRGGLTLALTERLRLGLDYRHLEGEDLWPEFADTGAAGYDSHHLLVRASWRF